MNGSDTKKLQRAGALAAAALLALSLGACTAEERSAVEKFCGAHPDTCALLAPKDSPLAKDPAAAPAEPTQPAAPASPAPTAPPATTSPSTPATPPAAAVPDGTRLTPTAIPADRVQPELRTWLEGRFDNEATESAILVEGDKTTVAVSAGLKMTGGYHLEITEAVRQGDKWVVTAVLHSPPPGGFVTMALTNPSAVAAFAGMTGEVEVRLTSGSATAGAGEKQSAGATAGTLIKPERLEPADRAKRGVSDGITVVTRWTADGMLNITGTANVPDLHFSLKKGDKVIAQADAQVKEGKYIANLIVAGGPQDGLVLEVSTVEPGGGTTLARVPVAR